MAIFNSYVKLPEGSFRSTKTQDSPWFLGGFPCQASQVYLQLGEQERAMQVGLEALLGIFGCGLVSLPSGKPT